MPDKYQSYPPDWPSWKIQLGIYPPAPPTGPGGNDEDGEPESPEDAEPEDDDDDQDFEPEEPEDDLDGNDVGEVGPEYELPPLPVQRRHIDPLDKREFATWNEFITSATDETLVGWKGRRSSREIDSDPGSRHGHIDRLPWHGTNTWEETLDLIRKGWPEGRKMLEDSIALVRPRPEPFKSIEMSVAGAFPMVPNYCAGDPECMVVMPGSDMRHSMPIIRIDFNNWTHAGVAPESMMLRGAAVVSLADSLERHGYSVELRVVGNTKAGATPFRYSIVYKKAGEYLDLDRAAFAIAHPACMRRLAFAILEQHAEAERAYTSGYGMPMYEPNDPTSGKTGGAIYIPPVRGRETAASARAAVEIAARTTLDEIRFSEETGAND